MVQKISVLGIDIAKLVFHIVGMDDTGHVVLRKRITRGELLHFIATLPPVRMGMAACGSAHYWARRFREQGHEGRLIAPQFVTASVKSPKNDTREAEAICEAVTRPTMRFVPIKQLAQPDLQALPRVRERLIKARTALVNELRGLLSEYGMVLPQGMSKFRTSVVRQLADEQTTLTPLSPAVCWHLYEEVRALEKRVAYDNEKLQALARAQPVCQRVQAIPGIGPLTATARVAARAQCDTRQTRPPTGGLARPRTPRALHGRQAPSAGHEQAGGCLSSHTVRPRRASPPALGRHDAGRPQSVAQRAHGSTRPEPRGGRLSQEERPDGLGTPGAQPRIAIQDGCRSDGVVTISWDSPTRCLAYA